LFLEGGSGWTLGAPFTPLYPLGFGLDYLKVTYGASAAVVDPVGLSVNVTVALNNAAPVTGEFGGCNPPPHIVCLLLRARITLSAHTL
jgi:hypothetical protein